MELFPYIVEAEIVEVKASEGARKLPLYNCRALMPNGSYMVLVNVQESGMFGGIGDYFQRRARVTKDSDSPKSLGSEDMAAAVGDRVYIAFINGFITKPVIIGYAPHPNQTEEFTGDESDPKAVFQYNGVRVEISETGSLVVKRKGAPEVKYAPRSGVGGLLALASGSSEPLNDALKPAADTEVVMFEMTDGGLFKLRDANGQFIELDRESKTITIGNNGQKSTDTELSTPSLGGSEKITVSDGDKAVMIEARDKIGTNSKGTSEHSSAKAWTVKSMEAVELEGAAAKLKLSQGKVGLGGPGGELLDLFDKLLDEINTHVTDTMTPTNQSNGNLGYLVVQAPSYTQSLAKMQTKILEIKTKLGTIKGGI